jgi:hypothetical protein
VRRPERRSPAAASLLTPYGVVVDNVNVSVFE